MMTTTPATDITMAVIGGSVKINVVEESGPGGPLTMHCSCTPEVPIDQPPQECDHTRQLRDDSYRMMYLRKELDSVRRQ